MNDAWARLCESVGATPETVLPGYALVGKQPGPPAYLRKPNRTRWRGIIRAALGKRACGWAYRNEVDHWPPAHVGCIRKGLVWFDRFWELHREGLSICNAAKQANEELAAPAAGGQSAGETRAKEGRSTEVSHGDGQQ